ncbi:hypothetical protein [Spirillospora sp. NPDC048823]|uniref:hypothetical protein n=1 Tax=unclassified Spirillospora TaxID=2642701 RepID=UPI00371C4BF5
MSQQNPHTSNAVQVHTFEMLTTPGGEHVQIDWRMVPLVQALWDTGIGTFQCCEDVGASIYGGGWLYPKPRRIRYAAFWDGFAWLQMPLEDAERLVALAADITAGQGWECSSPITALGRRPGANLYFPARQIDQVLALLMT